jgi:hypothetical protein
MKIAQYLKTKLNRFSIIGSLIYGLLCTSYPTPEIIAIIGCIPYFLSSGLFYFTMYILYSEHKAFVSRLWENKIRNAGIFVLILFVVPNVASSIYMLTNHVPFNVAADRVATCISNFFYYIPFLP